MKFLAQISVVLIPNLKLEIMYLSANQSHYQRAVSTIPLPTRTHDMADHCDRRVSLVQVLFWKLTCISASLQLFFMLLKMCLKASPGITSPYE